MSEEEIIDILQNVICDEVIGTYCVKIQKQGVKCDENCKDDDCYLFKAIQGIIDLYNKEKEINEEHQKINGELQERIKELEKVIYDEDLTTVYINGFYDGKKKSKDKIKELLKDVEDTLNMTINNETRFFLEGLKNSLEELLNK